MNTLSFYPAVVAALCSSFAFAAEASPAHFGPSDLAIAHSKTLERISEYEGIDPSTGLSNNGTKIDDATADCKRVKGKKELRCKATYLADRWLGEVSITFVKDSSGAWIISSEKFDGNY